MPLGILEPSSGGHVPGTVLLDDSTRPLGRETRLLKHATGKHAHIVLAPQPSEDPNDPLNWSFFEKHLILFILSLGAIVNGAVPGPILQAGVLPISLELNVNYTKVTLLAGYVLLAAGSFGIFVSTLARRFGKRPLYVFCSTMSVVGCIIGETAQSYNTLVAARVVQGLGVGAYESLVVASIGDIFYVHERGPRVAILMFLLATATNGILIIAGPITANLGWHYNFHILLPFVVLQLILVLLFVPETTYHRKKIYNIDEAGSEQDLGALGEAEERARKTRGSESEAKSPSEMQVPSVPPPRDPFMKRLTLYNGSLGEGSILKMLISPVVILLNLGALYNILVSGISLAWFVGMSIISTVIFSSPPYLFSAAGVGYTSVAPLVGGMLATIFMVFASSHQVIWMVKRNKGYYEPEYRLPLISLGLITSVAGIIGFGYAVRDLRSVYVICCCWGTMMFGLNIVAITTSAYVLDAFREHSTEIFVVNMLFKNFFFYGLTNYVVDWFFTQGPTNMFNVIGGITAACILTSIPMYVYGKRYRHFWSHHNLIRKLGLESGSEEVAAI